MAVLIEGVSVVIQTHALKSHFKGGWTAFYDRLATLTMCRDDELLAVLLTNMEEANMFASALVCSGLTHHDGETALDFVIVDQIRGPLFPTTWLNFGVTKTHDFEVRTAWKSIRDHFVVPEGWAFEGSRSQDLVKHSKLTVESEFPQFGIVKHKGKPVLVEPFTAIVLKVKPILDKLDQLKKSRPIPKKQIAKLQEKLRQTYLDRLSYECSNEECRSVEAQGLLGMINETLGEDEDALNAYQRASDLAPGNSDILRCLTQCALRLRNYEVSATTSRSLTELEPNNGQGWAYFSVSLFHLKRVDEARSAINRAIELEPLSVLFQTLKNEIDA